MTTQQTTTPTIDQDRLMAFVFRAVEEVGATLNTALVVLGDELGYYRALAEHGPLTAAELAGRTSTAEPYAREWCHAQAAGGFIELDEASGRFTLPAEHAVALTDASSPAYLPGLFQIALGTVADAGRLAEAARSGTGVGWHEHGNDVIDGCERFFAPSYQAYLVDAWLPAAGLDEDLRRGIRVADIGCGHGASTVLMAQAFPQSRFVGSDYHEPSIEVARRRAEDAGVGANTSFETSLAVKVGGEGFDLATTFDALHDMGDPDGAARHVHRLLADGGRWLIVEPMAGDAPQDNFNPVGRAYYGFSTLLCTPASLSQEGAAAIGTQAGPARVEQIVTGAGFASCETVATTPFHRVMLARRTD
ncbi:methyltransferase domain-containing protein [Aeromicrobium sp. Marseille-Q0843]|uniref:Methyltransferase domain-containing protein n=1 Tax=Aeromicrobium phoceense TaxID=2754045 RepID=A0A838XDW9_9ACTN|nr:methyltransferase domain-containing protein [Aeromicrobium phoceense]MBA4609659.1 methyltransferase domain-containing protein [Aeromicrobium phoceense]